MPDRRRKALQRGLSQGQAALLLFAFLLTGCAASATKDASAQEQLLVAAAASLEDAFSEIGAAYEAETGRPVAFVFGSSGKLATQIENGAPFDVFASADAGFVNRLAARNLILPDTRSVYAEGRLALAVNRESGLDVTTLDDLTDPAVRRVAIANPDLAPYGLAARQALERRGLWETVSPKIVQGANVRQTLQYVQTGDAQAGLTALSIVDAPEVIYTVVDAGLYAPLDQTIAVVAATDQEAVARDFVAWVLGPAGQSVLADHGFASPGEEP